MHDDRTRRTPPAANRGRPEAPSDGEAESIVRRASDNSRFAPLTEDELLAAIHPDTVAAEQRGYEAGWADGYAAGAIAAKAECLADHATVANRIDAAARAFYLLEADDAAGVGE